MVVRSFPSLCSEASPRCAKRLFGGLQKSTPQIRGRLRISIRCTAHMYDRCTTHMYVRCTTHMYVRCTTSHVRPIATSHVPANVRLTCTSDVRLTCTPDVRYCSGDVFPRTIRWNRRETGLETGDRYWMAQLLSPSPPTCDLEDRRWHIPLLGVFVTIKILPGTMEPPQHRPVLRHLLRHLRELVGGVRRLLCCRIAAIVQREEVVVQFHRPMAAAAEIFQNTPNHRLALGRMEMVSYGG